MRTQSIKNILILSVLAVSGSLLAADVYTWRTGNGSNSYSDSPRNLKPAYADLISVHTTQVLPVKQADTATASEPSLVDKQSQLNDQIIKRNKELEERNKEVEKRNQQIAETNCKAARMNRAAAENARTNNREQLLARYDADIARFCK